MSVAVTYGLNEGLALTTDALECSTKKFLHAKEQIRIILAIDRDKAILPLQSCDAPRKTVLHVPEDTSTKID